MEQQEMMRRLFFFKEIEKKAMTEIRNTGALQAAVYALTEKKSEEGRNCVCVAEIPNFMDKNGIEFLTAAMQLSVGMKVFINKVERNENSKVIAIFHCELVNDDEGKRLFTMRKIRQDDDESDDMIKVFKIVHGESSVDENGNVVPSKLEFVEEEE